MWFDIKFIDEIIIKKNFSKKIDRSLNSKLIKEKLKWSPTQPLKIGLEKTYEWIEKQIK